MTTTPGAAAAPRTHSSHHAAHCRALFAFEALRSGPIFTVIYESGAMVTEVVDWVHTSQAQRLRVSRPEQESRLLVGLGAAASFGLVQLRVTPHPGDPSAYCVRWERLDNEA